MKIFIDLDGVLTDFAKQLCTLLDMPLDRSFDFGNDTEVWKKIDGAGEDFWSEMEWMPGGQRLWDEIKKYNPTILTAPSRHESSVKGKKKWLKDNLPGVPFIIEEDKSKYAGPGSILIDDREKNIDAWEKAGGTPIKHDDTSNTIEELSKIMKNTDMKKKACLSFFIRQAAEMMSELGPTFTSKAPGRKVNTPTQLKNKPVLWAVERYKKNLMYNSLSELAKKLRSQGGGGKNSAPMSNINKLIDDLKSAEVSVGNSEDTVKDITRKALNVFQEGHPKASLNWDIAEFVRKTINNDDASELKTLANKINPRENMKGDTSQRVPQHFKWAADKIVEVAKNVMLKYAAIKKIKTEDGKAVTIDKPRLHDTSKPPKIMEPTKGGRYTRNEDWKKGLYDE